MGAAEPRPHRQAISMHVATGTLGSRQIQGCMHTNCVELRSSSNALLQVHAKQEESDRQAAEVARLHATTPEQLYHADLDAFEAALDERDEEEAREAELLVTQRGRAGRASGGKVGVLAGCAALDQA